MRLRILHVPDCPNTAVLRSRLDQVLAGRRDVDIDEENTGPALIMLAGGWLVTDR